MNLPDPTPNPAGARASGEAASAALVALLQPALALALEAGLKYADVDALVRQLLVQLAPQALREVNTSQVAVITGLNRKEVARLQLESGDSAPHKARKRSLASQVFLAWVQAVAQYRDMAEMPLVASLSAQERAVGAPDPGGAAVESRSFHSFVRSLVSDVHPRAVLDELLRLGLVAEQGGRVRLIVNSFVPHGIDDRLSVMAGNVADHFSAGVANLQGSTPQLEQAIWGEGLSLQDAQALDATARRLWAAAHATLYAQIAAAPEAAPGEVRYRAKVGMFTHASVLREPPI